MLDKISDQCETCKMNKKSNPHPVVGMPLAREFNDLLVLDLKVWDKHQSVYIFHMIDYATRFSRACVIRRKTSDVIVDSIMTIWIGGGFGPPAKILHDNGGEFANAEVVDMCDNLGIEILTTAALAPWSNGLCERNLDNGALSF